MIKAIVFDLDNTLIDFWKMKVKSCDAAITAMISSGLKIKKDRAMKILFALYEKHGIEHDHIFQKFLLSVNGNINYRILVSAIVAYRRVQAGWLYPYPNTISVLKKLKKKKLKIGIVTDAPRLNAWIRLAEMGIDSYFDAVTCLEDTGKKKPDKRPFLHVLRKLSVKPADAIMVGDNVERDIKGAMQVGMKTCYAKYGSRKKNIKSNADYKIDNISELLKII